MAHQEQLDFVATLYREFPEFFVGKRVLEVGSGNASLRSFFRDCDYVGVDVLGDGKIVDVESGSFDVVVSCGVVEQDPQWPQTMQNMLRICRDGGLLAMTCATPRPHENGTLRAGDFRRAGAVEGLSHVFASNWESRDLYLVGFKGSVPMAQAIRLLAVRRAYRKANWSLLRLLRVAARAARRGQRS